MIIARDSNDVPKFLLVDGDNYLDVKTHTPDLFFKEDFSMDQVDVLILPPRPGQAYVLQTLFISTDSTNENVVLKAAVSGKILLKLYTTKAQATQSALYPGQTEKNEGVLLSCGEDTFISIGYELKPRVPPPAP